MRRGRRVYARRPRRTRRVVGAVLIIGVAGAGIGAAVRFTPSWLGLESSSAPASPPHAPSPPGCATARIAGDARLGDIAWIRDGVLHLLDLDTCDERTLVPQGAAPPVRFSHDGRWIAFGQGLIVASAGGQVLSPLGPLSSWQWSPTHDVLAGVTTAGGVVLGGPALTPRMLLPAGTGAGHVAFSADGRSLALDVSGDGVEVVDVTGGAAATIYRVTPGTKAPPQVAGWSPTGAGCCSSRGSPERQGSP